MSTADCMMKYLDQIHQLRLAIWGMNRAGRSVVLALLAPDVVTVEMVEGQ